MADVQTAAFGGGRCELPDLAEINPHNTLPTTSRQGTCHPELISARGSIARGKLTVFEREAWHLAYLARVGVLTVADAIGTLAEADVFNDLSVTFGADLVHEIVEAASAAKTCAAEELLDIEVPA